MLYLFSRLILCKFHERQFYKPRLWPTQVQGIYIFPVIAKMDVNVRFLTKRLNMKPVKKKHIKKPYNELIQVLEKYQRDLASSKLKFHLNSSPIPDIEKSEKMQVQKSSIAKEVPSKPEKSKSKKSKKKKKNEVNSSSTRLSKEPSYFISLKSYIVVCLHVNMHQQAHNVLKTFKFNDATKSYSNFLLNSGVFELMIQGWASKGNINMLLELTDIIKEIGGKLTLNVYASLLECLNRQSVVNLSEVEKVINELQANGHCLQDIFDKCKFVGDQREQILEAIRKLIPDYCYQHPTFPTKYSCNLVAKLNENSSESYIYPSMENTCTLANLQQYALEQLELEKCGQITIKNISRKKKISDKTSFLRKQLEACEKEWREVLRLSFLQNLECLWNQVKHVKGLSMYPYLAILDVDDYVDIMMQEIRNLAEASESFSQGCNYLCRMLGGQVMLKYMTWIKKQNGVSDKLLLVYQKYLELILDKEYGTKYTPRDLFRKIDSETSPGLSIDVPLIVWPPNILNGIGKFLLEIIIHEVQISRYILKSNKNVTKKIPALYKIFRHHGLMLKEEIKAHPLIIELYRAVESENLTFSAAVVPMSSPPLPWISPVCGGNLLMQTEFVRQASNQSIIENHPLPELYPCMDSLNVLAVCPWIINKPVLDLIIDLFNRDGSNELDVPPPPHTLREPNKASRDNSNILNAKLNYEKLVYRQKKAEMYSLWCDALYKLSIANHFRDRIFWFPHNMDFRGRVYPTPPHFNHLGSDLARSILLFAKGKPLGENGLNWLKIHVINLTGTKKRDSLEDRLKYANEILPDIIDSADRPFEGNKWWMKSDDPWQTLACCMEIAKAIRSPDPKKYVCHFPVHQDGSCNGLQHYSALGRDFEGAQQVNLYPCPLPQDVYTGVANLVEEQRVSDAASSLQIAQSLEGFVTRKVVKQTVMTIVYGVTRFGARLQIHKRLKEIDEFPDEYAWAASLYLVSTTFYSIQKMFTATRLIQNWFTECSQLISKVKGEPMCWVTPLGFPIMQPYQKQTSKNAHYQLKPFSARAISGQPNILKQKNGFPPNFIHSLDSSHMMLTSLFCQREGILFQSVHDCFWTHPNTVDAMNKICREQFVALHSEPILENLSKFMVDNFAFSEEEIKAEKNESSQQLKRNFNNLLVQIPPRGNFNLESVLYSTYFFS